MKFPVFFATLLTVGTLFGGTLNVVHLGPRKVLQFEVSVGDAEQSFALAHEGESGPFALPNRAATLSVSIHGVGSIALPVSEASRLAVLVPVEEGYRLELVEVEPVHDHWSFRIINLASAPVDLMAAGKPVKLAAQGRVKVPVSGRRQIRLEMGEKMDLSYEGSEARAVLALVYRSGDQWKGLMLPER
jgi:hypothetical protein